MSQGCDLSFNRFTGALPITIGGCVSLQDFRLVCQICAQIWSTNFVATKLILFSGLLQVNNNLHGPLPSEIGHMKSLRVFMAQVCPADSIPHHVCSQTILIFSLGESHLRQSSVHRLRSEEFGKVVVALQPGRWQALVYVFVLVFSNDGVLTVISATQWLLCGLQISGTIPISVGDCDKLSDWRMHGNRLGGSLPSTINQMKELR